MESNEKLRVNYQNMYKDYQLTKIISLRVQRAMIGENNEMFKGINTTRDLKDKVSDAETMLKTLFQGRSHIQRSQSE